MFEVNVKNMTEEGREGEGGPAQVWGSDGSNLMKDR